MTPLTLEGREIRPDEDDCLAALDDWSGLVAEVLVAREELALTVERWEILQLLREPYAEFQLSPVNRLLIEYVARRPGPDKGNSLHPSHLFRDAPTKLGAKLADLLKPDNYL